MQHVKSQRRKGNGTDAEKIKDKSFSRILAAVEKGC